MLLSQRTRPKSIGGSRSTAAAERISDFGMIVHSFAGNEASVLF